MRMRDKATPKWNLKIRSQPWQPQNLQQKNSHSNEKKIAGIPMSREKKSEIFTATEIYLQVMTRQSQKRAAAAKHEECELRRCMVHH